MTPLQIEILLWYHCRAVDYRDGDFSAPAVREAIDDFRDRTKALEDCLTPASSNRTYQLSDRGQAYIKYLCSVPLPECRWIISHQAEGGES